MRLSPAKVLVVSDNPIDANQVVEQVGKEFVNIRSSTDAERAAFDFEDVRPEVLVLAFDSLAKAQRYSLGLYRASLIAGTHRHSTVLLCCKDEARAAFELCKSDNFDDYVLHWPQSQDGNRLLMSVWNAARHNAASTTSPSRQAIEKHVRQVINVDSVLQNELSEGEAKLGSAANAMHAVHEAVGAAIDGLAHRLAKSGRGAFGRDSEESGLAGELRLLKEQDVAEVFKTGVALATELAAWPAQVRDRLEPHMAGMRAFAVAVGNTRRSILVVDDDKFARQLIAKALEDQACTLEFAEDGAAALRVLRTLRPMLILMDIRLPDMDGVALTRRLKASPHLAEIPVLMLTGDARRETLAGSIEAGAVGFVVKPFTRDALLQQMTRALT